MATKLTLAEMVQKREEAQKQINDIISQLESDCDGCCVKIDTSYVTEHSGEGCERRLNHVYVEILI